MGVEARIIEGVSVQLTSPAKIVADCFNYRRYVGLEVALAALRDYLQTAERQPKALKQQAARRGTTGNRDVDPRRYSIDALVEAAQVDRVYTVMRPYLEALA